MWLSLVERLVRDDRRAITPHYTHAALTCSTLGRSSNRYHLTSGSNSAENFPPVDKRVDKELGAVVRTIVYFAR
jgi:hypothetical protein